MKFQKLNIIFISAVFASVIFYSFLLFGVPAILNSGFMVKKYENLIAEKTGFPVNVNGFRFKTNPNLSFDVKVNKVLSKTDKGEDVVNLDSLFYKSNVLSIKPKSVTVDNIYADFSLVKDFAEKQKRKSGKSSFNLGYFPILKIKNVFVKLDEKSSVTITNLISKKTKDGVVCGFLARFDSVYAKQPVYIGKEGFIYYTDNLFLDDLSIDFGKSKLYVSGEFKNLHMYGRDLPVEELEKAFLFFYRLKHFGKKNFIENFHNFDGKMDVDLRFSKSGVNGKCHTHGLRADFSKFMIPVVLPDVVFEFKDRNMQAKANGTFGTEPVYTDVYISGIATDDVRTVGNVRSDLTNEFTKKYFKPVQIIGSANAKVQYRVHKKGVNISYILGLKSGNNLISEYGNLDNTERHRQISAHTLKQGDRIYLKNYKYEFIDKGRKPIFLGDGLFIKRNGHFKPSFISLKTVENIPVAVIKSFLKDFLDNGTFNADLKYDFLNKHISGFLNLFDTHHRDYLYLKETVVKASDNLLKINADGMFFDSPIKLSFNADNDFSDGLKVNDIDIYLQKYYVKRGNVSSVKSGFHHDKSDKHKVHNIDIKKGRIRVGEIIHSKFYLHNVEILGNLKDDIVNFIIPETDYAKGTLSAKGKYDVICHNSDIHFLAAGMDSNEVATKIFNLPNQVEGTGYAKLHLLTKNKLNDIHAHASFAIQDGFLPRLGSKEFIFNRPTKLKKVLFFLNKPIKFTLSKVTNIDFSKPNVFYSDLRGSLIINNDDVEDVRIFSQSDYLSMFIEGYYNIATEIGCLCIWGRHNRVAEKKIKIFKIPLSLLYKIIFKVERTKNLYIDKVNLIPPIKAEPYEEAIFRVEVDGNLNSNDINVNLKDLK